MLPERPSVTPSYSPWAMRIVLRAVKFSFLLASCCITLVVNGSGALRCLPRSHLIRCALELSENGVHFFLGADRRQLFAVFLGKLRLEGFFLVIFQRHFQRPVFLRNKIKDLFFALTDETQRHRLHTPGAEAFFHLAPACSRQCGRARGAPAAHPHDPYRSRVVP